MAVGGAGDCEMFEISFYCKWSKVGVSVVL